jgi:lysozyme
LKSLFGNSLGTILRVIVTAIFVTAGAAAIYFFAFRPDSARYPIRGIDVSRHQGEIDWQRVAGDEIDFAYIKATEGGDWRDPIFKANWDGARKAGLKTGAYHFFTLCRPAIDQAKNFVEMLPKESDALPPVLDIEYVGNCSRRPSKEELKTEIGTFVAHVEAETGRQLMLYVPVDFLAAYGSVLPKRPLWRRSILRAPRSDNWLLWQYHFAGLVDGVSGASTSTSSTATAPRSRSLRASRGGSTPRTSAPNTSG